MRQAQTRRNGWRWLALAVGTLSALSLAEASMARWPAGWQVSDLPAAQPDEPVKYLWFRADGKLP
ncbi:DUF4946 domain-containing protein, partial [Pseudomonas aeruginosa]|uniref:DUF4946 domain-containing protein n=1 Tax=Pseudomonas aeruginosa TaxID=287 RepID=UPI000EE2BA0F|nr:hypothetical protein [Pseudomonas aeruginosa]